MRQTNARRTTTTRALASAAVLGAALTLTGCGMDAQTLQPYTPAHGINVDVPGVKVRNLLVVANDAGAGVVSASILAADNDALTSVAGQAIAADGATAGPLTVTGAPVTLAPGTMTVLTGGTAPVAVTASGLKPGLTAKLTLTFRSGAAVEAVVPVQSAADPIYQGIKVG